VETLSISKFKATCLEVLARVKRTGQPVRITRRGEPIAEVVPPQPCSDVPDWLGSFRDRGRILGDVVEPTGASWDALDS